MEDTWRIIRLAGEMIIKKNRNVRERYIRFIDCKWRNLIYVDVIF